MEGHNIWIEWRWAAGKVERFPSLAAELATQTDVIVAAGPHAVVAAARATRTIPVVMVAAADPVGLGLVASLPYPRGNVTGNAWDTTPEIFGKQVELLKESLPHLSRVAVLFNPSSPGAPTFLRATQSSLERLHIKAHVVEIRSADDVSGAFGSMTKNRDGAFLVIPDNLTYALRQSIIELASRERLPGMYSFAEMVEDGGLISYGPSLPGLYRRAARYVDKILKGTKPADLPVELPTTFELLINLRTAKAFGLTISPSLLLRADQGIQWLDADTACAVAV